jgi:hypothetical protein
MTKSKRGTLGRANLSEDEIENYYKEASLDALLFWTNSSVSHIGSNATLTLLTEMLATCIEHLVPQDQADRAEDVVFHVLEQSFEIVRTGSEESADKNNTQVSQKKSDKSDMN